MTQATRVLIVDDELLIRTLLARWITGWGYGVKHVESADEALEAMATDPADILLSDVAMPGHDGLWLVAQVHTRWPTTAIIMSTAQDDPQTVRTSRKLGALAYVIKPFDPVMVRSALDDVSVARTSTDDNGRKRERPLENVWEPCPASLGSPQGTKAWQRTLPLREPLAAASRGTALSIALQRVANARPIRAVTNSTVRIAQRRPLRRTLTHRLERKNGWGHALRMAPTRVDVGHATPRLRDSHY